MKRSSKALRAVEECAPPLAELPPLFDEGDAADVEVSRSRLVRASNSGHSLATSLGETRIDRGREHSKRAEGSKFVHCTQARRSCWHLGHDVPESACASISVPQRAQRATSRYPIMRGFLAPSDEMRRAPAGAPGSRSGRGPDGD